MPLLSSAGPERDPGRARAAGAAGARRFIGDLAAAAALLAATVILYHPILRLWWSHDDFFCLHFITEHQPWEYCLDRRVWQLLPFRMLTPLLFLSLHLDLRLFGADPQAFYAHQLAAAALAFLGFYAALRLWLPAPLAALGAGVVAGGVPTSAVLQMLTVRHYVEGFLLASISVLLFVRGLRRGRSLDLWLSALVYLAAALAKEVFVPLVALFPFAAQGTAGRRLRLAAPHLAAFFLYLGWRLHMLGTLGGGYGWSVRTTDLPGLAAALPLKMVRAIIGPSPLAGWLLLAALAAGAVAACLRSRRATCLFLLAVIAAAGPVLPASTDMEARYAFPLWAVLGAALAFGCDRLAAAHRAGKTAAILLAGIAGIAVLTVNRLSWAESYAARDRVSIENRALLSLPRGEYLRQPAGPPASLHELQWFRQGYLHLPPGGGWFSDDLFLCSLPPSARVLEYDPQRHLVLDISARAPHLRSSFCGSILANVPLSADLLLADGNLRWRLGPYKSGSYSLVVGGGIDAYPVPPVAGFQVPDLHAVTLRVHYRSPAGWNTYSPDLSLATAAAHVTYSR